MDSTERWIISERPLVLLLASAFLLAWPGKLRLLFLLTSIPGLIVSVLLMLGLREKRVVNPPRERLRITLTPFNLNFRLYLLALVVLTLGNSSDAFLLVRAGELGVPTALLPLLWCAFHVVKSVGNLLAGRAVDTIGPRTLIFAGWIIYALVYIAFVLINAAWQIWVVILFYGLFFALTEPASSFAALPVPVLLGSTDPSGRAGDDERETTD